MCGKMNLLNHNICNKEALSQDYVKKKERKKEKKPTKQMDEGLEGVCATFDPRLLTLYKHHTKCLLIIRQSTDHRMQTLITGKHLSAVF